MEVQTKMKETIQESQSILCLLESDLSMQQQERIYIDAVKVVRGLLETTLEYLE